MAKVVAISFPNALPAAIDAEAKRQRRSRSWIVSEAVRRYLTRPYAEAGATFQRGEDLTLLEGLTLDHTARAREAEQLWEEGWAFTPPAQPFVRVFETEAEIDAWKRSPESLRVVHPRARRVAERDVLARLVEVCGLLNRHEVRYVLIGGAAVNLHGVLCATKDVDVLIEPTVENATRALRALGGLAFGVARELDAEQVASRPFTIVGDAPRVDLVTVACGVTYQDAIGACVPVKVEGVPVPLADIDTLIRTKQTSRPYDAGDILWLERLRALGG